MPESSVVPVVVPTVVFSPDPEVQARCEAELGRRMDEFRTALEDENRKIIQAELSKLEESLTPPSQEEIQTLLSQEYLEFSVKLSVVNHEPGRPDISESRQFVIRELPQAVERKFYNILKEKLLPIAEQVGVLSFELLEGKVSDKVRAAITAFDAQFDLLTDAVVLILNPRGEVQEVTREWVSQNLSSQRMLTIAEAQMHVNRVRDFFSRAFRLSTAAATTTGSGVHTRPSPQPPAG